MYCGDETGAFIGDIGSHTSRFGYGGEDHPKHVAPSCMATKSGKNYIPSSCYNHHDNLKPIYRMASSEEPIVDPSTFLNAGDVIENWDALEHAWQHSFDVLRVRDRYKHTTGKGTRQAPREGVPSSSTIRSSLPEERLVHPILAVRQGYSHIMGCADDKATERKELEKYTELMFESLQADSCFIAPSPMLAAFSHGRQTCLVVDLGASGCRVTPVVDGLLLKQAQRRNGRGGDWLSNVTWKAMLEDKVTVIPRYRLRCSNPAPSPIMTQWAMRDLMFEFRTSDHVSLQTWRYGVYTTPFVAKHEEESPDESDNPISYELPDGTLVNLETAIGHDLKRSPELLFSDDVPFVAPNATSEHATTCNLPLHRLIHDSLSAVGDADIRKELCSNIVLVGGTSLLPNMEQRLSYEISGIISGKCKIVASKFPVERSQASFIGGSVLTSLGSFQQLWLSRKEYEDYGAALAIQRFP
ncbi:actin [Fragilaria crotonensis]|nr:actin [Fragilaria crotonensis]